MNRAPVIYHEKLPAWVKTEIPDFFAHHTFSSSDERLNPLALCNRVTLLFYVLGWPEVPTPPHNITEKTLAWTLGEFQLVVGFPGSRWDAEVSLYRNGVGCMATKFKGPSYEYGYLTLDQVKRVWNTIAKEDLPTVESIYADFEATRDPYREAHHLLTASK